MTEPNALVRYLSDRTVLIVLDNCEHVVAGAAALADSLLASAPEVHLVATSREPLGVDGEVVRRVQSLEVPPAGSSVAEASGTGGVRLFVDRGAAARQGFVLDAENVGPIVEICRHLDGIPLALELAGARVGALSPAEISRRLGERFRLLGGSSRRSHERHRTLFAAVSWSYELLTDQERAVFRRLAVFPSSFNVDAAQAIAGGDDVDGVGCLVRLVDRSLVQFDPEEGRYRLLETLRQYAADRLADTGETELAQERHARYFMDVVAGQAGAMRGQGYPAARAVLTAELDNLRAVAEWAEETGRWAELLGMCRQMMVFASLSRPDPTLWYQRVINKHPGLASQDRVDVLGELGYIVATHLGDWAAGQTLADESDQICAAERLALSPWAALAKALVGLFTGRYYDTLVSSKVALEAAESRRDEFAAVVALGQIGNALAYTDVEKSFGLGLDALARAERMGNPAVTAISALQVASSYLLTPGAPDFEGSLAVLTRYASDFAAGDVTAMWSRLIQGHDLLALDDSRALTYFSEAARLGDRLNAPHVVEIALRGLAVVAAEGGYVHDAAALVGYADANLAASRITNAMWIPLQGRLDQALRGSDLTVPTARGASFKRGDVIALIGELERRLDQPDSSAGARAV
jgi:predicted ATPase